MPGDLHLLSALIWGIIVILFASLLVLFLLTSRGVRLRLGVKVRNGGPATRRSLRAALFCAGAMIVTIFCLEITARETMLTRVLVLAFSRRAISEQ